MNIVIVTPNYPDRHKVRYPFVKQLVDEFARQGHCCFVIAPYSITNNKRFYASKEKDGKVMVYRPNYISVSNFRIGGFQLSQYLRRKAIDRAFSWLTVKPDVVYCHFWECVIEAYPYARSLSIPLYVASGESSIESFNLKDFSAQMRDYIRGVICVSTKNKEESISLGLTNSTKCIVSPNSVNDTVFRQMDQIECRKKIGVPEDVFIISFVGAFINRKGSNRVSAAINKIKGEPVYSFFVGRGDVSPSCRNILFQGQLPHEKIPVYLNASDAFVLPTLAEGCCNAIVEAMSCGLPIISSDLPFNRDVLDDSNSILIDPNDEDSLINAITKLRDDKEKRRELACASLNKAKKLTIDKRAKDILTFIEKTYSNNR